MWNNAEVALNSSGMITNIFLLSNNKQFEIEKEQSVTLFGVEIHRKHFSGAYKNALKNSKTCLKLEMENII
ncbi:CLUMA_CG017948, isoform A [Clunio marinus]|uniref:CLUMA_CG017948, isoform A n=1 Tax=Clunio marinus TaxID=568069 RepID=A0A1J1J214_9DIPT|nr:CLUMA_CG017948, isoform A [Clunio marinus]